MGVHDLDADAERQQGAQHVGAQELLPAAGSHQQHLRCIRGAPGGGFRFVQERQWIADGLGQTGRLEQEGRGDVGRRLDGPLGNFALGAERDR
ncbi:hypothetical protein FQZ97_1264820 [compost metagenome]